MKSIQVTFQSYQNPPFHSVEDCAASCGSEVLEVFSILWNICFLVQGNISTALIGLLRSIQPFFFWKSERSWVSRLSLGKGIGYHWNSANNPLPGLDTSPSWFPPNFIHSILPNPCPLPTIHTNTLALELRQSLLSPGWCIYSSGKVVLYDTSVFTAVASLYPKAHYIMWWL